MVELPDIAAPDHHPDHERHCECPEGSQRCSEYEIDLSKLLQRGLGEDTVEQRGESHVDDEEIHPGQRGVGNLLEFAAGKTDEDQPKIRQRKIDNVDHPRDPGRPTWRGLCIALNGRTVIWKVL